SFNDSVQVPNSPFTFFFFCLILFFPFHPSNSTRNEEDEKNQKTFSNPGRRQKINARRIFFSGGREDSDSTTSGARDFFTIGQRRLFGRRRERKADFSGIVIVGKESAEKKDLGKVGGLGIRLFRQASELDLRHLSSA